MCLQVKNESRGVKSWELNVEDDGRITWRKILGREFVIEKNVTNFAEKMRRSKKAKIFLRQKTYITLNTFFYDNLLKNTRKNNALFGKIKISKKMKIYKKTFTKK